MVRKPAQQNHHQITIILKSAISSRILLTLLILLWRSLLRPYDTSSSINPACLSSSSSSHSVKNNQGLVMLFPRVGSAIEESVVWDGVYFVRIAECGYEYEHYFAFFPLLPSAIYLISNSVMSRKINGQYMLIRFINSFSLVFAPLVPLIGYRAVLGLSGYVISSISFVLAAIYLYRLSLIILEDEDRAVRAAVLFCFNPASVFYSSIYTESLYSFLSIGGLYHLVSGSKGFSMIFFALSGAARSNGVINAGYICYQTMHKTFDAVFCERNFFLAVQVLTAGALSCLCIFLPFIAFQAYGYNNICLGHDEDGPSSWCKARIPLLYNYVQSHYWGVGFLRYFELKQLPNFILAFPILSLALGAITYYVKVSPRSFLTLGFRSSPDYRRTYLSSDKEVLFNSERECSTTGQGDHILRRRKQTIKDNRRVIFSTDLSYYDSQKSSFYIVPVILHLSFLTATAFFVMYVQVSTRFLSASPPLYWFASYLMESRGIRKRLGYIIWIYSAAYILLGSLLFSNFYPFT